jgi:hypothetical protein
MRDLIDEMPFCDVMELFDYWRDYPPMHWLMRAYVGYKPPVNLEGDLGDAQRMLNPGITGAKKLANAPERIRKMAESVKALNRGR